MLWTVYLCIVVWISIIIEIKYSRRLKKLEKEYKTMNDKWPEWIEKDSEYCWTILWPLIDNNCNERLECIEYGRKASLLSGLAVVGLLLNVALPILIERL